VPIPFLDWLLEQYFRKRMVRTIARRYGQALPPPVQSALAGGERSCIGSCIGLIVGLTIGLVKRTSRKILYVLTIKDAADQLSFYWQRAFLIGHMIEAGHLETAASAQLARQAMDQVLERSSSPLRGLAQQVISGTRHIVRTLLTARRGRQDDVIRQTEVRMQQNWASFAGYLASLAAHYDLRHRQLVTEGTASGQSSQVDSSNNPSTS
jgi:hypothetical protein